MQLTLDAPEFTPPAPLFVNLHAYDLIVINSSAGKDSMALLAYVAKLIKEQGYTGRVVVQHNDLGTTPSGQPIEWPGVAALAREHADQYGFEFHVRTRELGGLWHQLVHERRNWPSSSARWCTSDQKTSQGMKLVTELVTELREQLGITDRPIQVLYALGIRGEESERRASMDVLAVDHSHSSGNRTIHRWHPIRDWTWKQVWDQIKEAGLRPHAAYSWGMTRLSCSFCVLASTEDLLIAATRRPELHAELAQVEQQIGHSFKQDLSLAEMRAALDAAELEAAAPADAEQARQTVYQLAYTRIETIQRRRHEKSLTKEDKKPVPMWSAARIAAKAAAETTRTLAAARRALALAA
ncbi:phosphoadenosine phosphosulfate reductase family protein [Nonomuraea bangladeshensis]|uniref:phosphoadenosine phosphosulfate reductase domain-containing protein n=1 Tax=Nonomuraea bangladeshensis TaxID=404385 RepID=UPI003C30A0CE